MKPYAIKKVVAGLLLLTATAILAVGCVWEGPASPYYGDEYYRAGYYGAYDPGYYRSDVIVEEHRRPGGERPQVSHLPARSLPAPAPRQKSAPAARQRSGPRSEPMGR
jgi:hypothetical protein